MMREPKRGSTRRGARRSRATWRAERRRAHRSTMRRPMMRLAAPVLLVAAVGSVGCSFKGKGLGAAVEGGVESDEGDGGVRSPDNRAPDRPGDRPAMVDAPVAV